MSRVRGPVNVRSLPHSAFIRVRRMDRVSTDPGSDVQTRVRRRAIMPSRPRPARNMA